MKRSRSCAGNTLGRQNDIFDRAPAVPGRDRAVGPELLALALQGFRCDHLPLAMGQGPAFAHAVVVDRPDVEPPELKDEKHLRRPSADASDLDQPGPFEELLLQLLAVHGEVAVQPPEGRRGTAQANSDMNWAKSSRDSRSSSSPRSFSGCSGMCSVVAKSDIAVST